MYINRGSVRIVNFDLGQIWIRSCRDVDLFLFRLDPVPYFEVVSLHQGSYQAIYKRNEHENVSYDDPKFKDWQTIVAEDGHDRRPKKNEKHRQRYR